MMGRRNDLWRFFCLGVFLAVCSVLYVGAANPGLPLLNEPVDVSGDFRDFSNLYYLADRVVQFDPATASGKICWRRAQYQTRQAFDNMLAVIRPVAPNEFPERRIRAGPDPAVLHRVRLAPHGADPCRQRAAVQAERAVLDAGRGKAPQGRLLEIRKVEGGYRYTSPFGSVTILENPWAIEIRDAQGRLLTRTNHIPKTT